MRHPINGQVHPRFARVERAFYENFQLRGELGAAVCVWYRGRRVVDLWGGFTDYQSSDEWEADTLTNLFSVTKGLVAASFLMLAERGQVSYDDPVSRYWPELADHGPHEEREARASISVRTLLEHRSGLLGFSAPLSLETLADEAALLERLEREPLRWTPGERQGYHGVTFGLYAGALFKKIEGRSIGQFVREELRGATGADLYLGLTSEEEERLSSRIAPIFPTAKGDLIFGMLPQLFGRQTREGRFFRSAIKRSSDTAHAFGQPAALGARGLANFNRADVRRLELPWGNGLGSARGVAGLYQGLLTPNKLVSPETLALVHPVSSWAKRDAVLRKPLGFTLGFIKEEPHLFSPSSESFGHPGAGGALGLADPKHELAIGYVMNQMGYHVRSPRALALCHAIYESVSA